MTASVQPDHEHPQYVTYAALEALEGRLINRMAEMELRLERSISAAFWRQLLVLLGVIVALVLGLSIPIINLGITILGKLP
jgi:hypothetical protein